MFFYAFLFKEVTQHGINIELLTHIAKFVTKFRVRVDLVFVFFSKLAHVHLKVIINLSDLNWYCEILFVHFFAFIT